MALLLGPTGKLLLHNGKLFIDTNGTDCCCLPDICCGCEWLKDYHDAGIGSPSSYRIKITFSGPLSGYAILVAAGSGTDCLRFTTFGIGGDFSNVVDHCGLIATGIDFFCAVGDRSLDQLQITIVLGSASCNVTNLLQTEASCGPPLNVVFTAELDDIFAGGCALGGSGCDDGDILTMQVENMDPWP